MYDLKKQFIYFYRKGRIRYREVETQRELTLQMAAASRAVLVISWEL